MPGKQGVADLFIRRGGTGSTSSLVQVGDVLEVEAFVESNGAAVTQVTLFVSFDDTYLEIMPARQQGEVIRPFRQGGWLAGQVFANDTLDDVIGDSDINEIPGFQLRYSELISRFFDTPQRGGERRGGPVSTSGDPKAFGWNDIGSGGRGIADGN